VKECNEKEDDMKHDKEISHSQLNPLGKRKINFSIDPVPEKQRSVKWRCTSWQIKAAEFLTEEVLSAWLLNPWSFWSLREGNYINCIRVTLINHGLKDSHVHRIRRMIAHLWLIWEENPQAELDKINAKSLEFDSQVKQTLDKVSLRYTLHLSFAPQSR